MQGGLQHTCRIQRRRLRRNSRNQTFVLAWPFRISLPPCRCTETRSTRSDGDMPREPNGGEALWPVRVIHAVRGPDPGRVWLDFRTSGLQLFEPTKEHSPNV